jgi:hypothetical protein
MISSYIRSMNSPEVKLPLPCNNPLILACDAVLTQKANGKWSFHHLLGPSSGVTDYAQNYYKTIYLLEDLFSYAFVSRDLHTLEIMQRSCHFRLLLSGNEKNYLCL